MAEEGEEGGVEEVEEEGCRAVASAVSFPPLPHPLRELCIADSSRSPPPLLPFSRFSFSSSLPGSLFPTMAPAEGEGGTRDHCGSTDGGRKKDEGEAEKRKSVSYNACKRRYT